MFVYELSGCGIESSCSLLITLLLHFRLQVNTWLYVYGLGDAWVIFIIMSQDAYDIGLDCLFFCFLGQIVQQYIDWGCSKWRLCLCDECLCLAQHHFFKCVSIFHFFCSQWTVLIFPFNVCLICWVFCDGFSVVSFGMLECQFWIRTKI